jgi:hypothetical protein
VTSVHHLEQVDVVAVRLHGGLVLRC